MVGEIRRRPANPSGAQTAPRSWGQLSLADGWLTVTPPPPVFLEARILKGLQARHLEELEDLHLAERALKRIRNDEEKTLPLEDVMKPRR